MAGKTATMTTATMKNGVAIKSSNPFSSTASSPGKQGSTTASSMEAKAILDNYDMETADRRVQLEIQIQSSLATLRKKCDREIAKIASALALDSMTAYEFVNVHGCDIASAVRAVQARGGGARGMMVESTAQAVEEEKEEIGRTIRKRKRVHTNNTDNTTANSTADETTNPVSPTKPRKNMRVAPPSPSCAGTAGLAPLSNARARVPSSSNKRVPSSSSTRTSTSNAGNFIYRARPSVVPLSLNPRLPQTPQVRNGSAGGGSMATITQSKTARRLPKRNESIQAYSMNGSPLGMMDLVVDAGPSNKSTANPSSSAASASASASETEEDWEILQRNSQQAPPFSSQPQSGSSFSPQKLGRKGSTIASSAFKAAIISGASKFTSHPSSSRHQQQSQHQSQQNSGLQSPTKGKFTLSAPGIDHARSKLDWESWTQSFRKEMEGMDMSADDRKRLEGRLKEMMTGGAGTAGR